MNFHIDVTELHHGFVEVEADNEEEARNKALTAVDMGNDVWTNDEITEVWFTDINEI